MGTETRDTSKLTKTRLILAGTALVGVVWAGTFASFSDSGESGQTFTAGTLDLLVGGDPDDAYAFTTIEMDNVEPGGVKYAPLTLTNSGSLALRYAMATSATNTDNKGLASAMTLEARIVASEAACDSGGTGFTASNTIAIPPGPLASAAIAGRVLAAGTSEILCYRVALPSTAGNELQGATTTATFSFTGSQV